MIAYDFKQGSQEWLTARLGIPTASEFDQIMTPQFKPRTGLTPENYVYLKIAERIMGYPQDEASSFAMVQGELLEKEAIPFFEFTYDVEVKRVGFCTTDDKRVGCSPDGLIGDDCGLEIKCPRPKTHVQYLLQNRIPEQYLAQVYGGMYVTGRSRWKFMSYSRHMPSLVIEAVMTDAIREKIHDALSEFLSAFDHAWGVIAQMQDAQNQIKQSEYDRRVSAGEKI